MTTFPNASPQVGESAMTAEAHSLDLSDTLRLAPNVAADSCRTETESLTAVVSTSLAGTPDYPERGSTLYILLSKAYSDYGDAIIKRDATDPGTTACHVANLDMIDCLAALDWLKMDSGWRSYE